MNRYFIGSHYTHANSRLLLFTSFLSFCFYIFLIMNINRNLNINKLKCSTNMGPTAWCWPFRDIIDVVNYLAQWFVNMTNRPRRPTPAPTRHAPSKRGQKQARPEIFIYVNCYSFLALQLFYGCSCLLKLILGANL